MRLDKYISQNTDFSRKDVKRLLRSGAVTVDGETVSDPALHINEDQRVELEGAPLTGGGPRYFMLNKPEGYVCATKDSEHPTVIDLINEPNSDRLQIAGRLDIDTTGLVLITDDGQWNHAVTSPRRGCKKRYYVTTDDDIGPDTIRHFEKGVYLDSEKRRTLPAELELLYANEARLTIREGKYHQVKRMFAAMGNRVDSLHRESVGSIILDEDLAPGDYRPLTDEEVQSVYNVS